MNENEFDLAARAWLDDGPSRISDRAVLSALEEIHATRQRRALWPAWRAAPVSIFARVAAAASLVAVGLLAVNVVERQPDTSSVGGPSPSASPSQAADVPNLTTTFVSPWNGFSIKYPEGATVRPVIEDGFDVVDTGAAGVFEGTSTDFLGEIMIGESGRTVDQDEQIDSYLSDDGPLPGGCGVPRSRQTEITIDGQSGRIAECSNGIEATVFVGGKLYVFRLSHGGSDARAVFEALVATIDLTPETAVHIPAMTRTFVSPTYGYSFRYRGGVTPATERWDPSSQPLKDPNLDSRFDAVETGLAAYFESASTRIPNGVAIDEWVDEYVTPLVAGGCGVPRGQQAEITIDGQSGRIARCDHSEATVVAGGRLYLFFGPGQSSRNTAWFDSWLATIDLRPEDAAVTSSKTSS